MAVPPGRTVPILSDLAIADPPLSCFPLPTLVGVISTVFPDRRIPPLWWTMLLRSKTSYRVRSLPRISNSHSSVPIPNIIIHAGVWKRFRTASRRNDLADPFDPFSRARSPGKSGITVARSFAESSAGRDPTTSLIRTHAETVKLPKSSERFNGRAFKHTEIKKKKQHVYIRINLCRQV